MQQINNLRTEQKYKKTEAGKIPVDWEAVQLKEVTKEFINGGTPSTKNSSFWKGNIPWITGADFDANKIRNVRRHITKEAIKASSTNVIPKGNPLIVTRTGVGKLALAPFNVAISQDITGIISDDGKISSNYLFWYLSHYPNKLKYLMQGTSINGILRNDLGMLNIALPPLEEQKKIAEILLSVDAVIEKSRKIAESSKKLKNGIAQKLLTSGIGRKKLKKTSIGMISNDWEVVQVKDVCNKPEYGYTQSATNQPVGPKFLRITDIQDSGVDWDNVPYCQCSEEDEKYFILKPGDILFARTGATTGKSYLITECPRSIFASYLIRLTTKNDIDSDFLYFVFNSTIYWNQIMQQMGGSAQGGVNATSLSTIRVPLPSIKEQKQISKILLEINHYIKLQERIIQRIEILKKGLMQVLLSGQVRVKA